jgi:hypothetical protein
LALLATLSCSAAADPFPFSHLSAGLPLREEEVLAFVHSELGSVWALELLILLKSNPDKNFRLEELVLQLRSSTLAVAQGLTRLKDNGFADETADGTYCFAPRSPRHLQMASAIQSLSLEKPMTLIKAIAEIPNEQLRNFSDAFKIRDD